jgi:hypothetical protein
MWGHCSCRTAETSGEQEWARTRKIDQLNCSMLDNWIMWLPSGIWIENVLQIGRSVEVKKKNMNQLVVKVQHYKPNCPTRVVANYEIFVTYLVSLSLIFIEKLIQVILMPFILAIHKSYFFIRHIVLLNVSKELNEIIHMSG